MQLDFIEKEVQKELASLEQHMFSYLDSNVSLINELKNYILQNGGKRLRPLMVLLSARLCNYPGTKHIALAAIIEFIHTATLLHDDVVDNSQLRRGQQSVNARWGNASAVLVGDFLYARAFQLSLDLDNVKILEILAQGTTQLAEGEALQLSYRHNPDLSEAQYFQIIQHKTATLFKIACQLAAVLSKAPPEIETALSLYGFHLGCAFQLMDDILDYQSTSLSMGKQPGDDLAEGKATLPLIHLFNSDCTKQIALAKHALQTGDRSQLSTIINAIESAQGIEYTVHCAKQQIFYAIQALENLPDSPCKQSACKLAYFTIERAY